jgi:hypothetical protein
MESIRPRGRMASFPTLPNHAQMYGVGVFRQSKNSLGHGEGKATGPPDPYRPGAAGFKVARRPPLLLHQRSKRRAILIDVQGAADRAIHWCPGAAMPVPSVAIIKDGIDDVAEHGRLDDGCGNSCRCSLSFLSGGADIRIR